MGKRAAAVFAALDAHFRKHGGARCYVLAFSVPGAPDLLLRWQDGSVSFVELKTTDELSAVQELVMRQFESRVYREGDDMEQFFNTLPRYRPCNT